MVTVRISGVQMRRFPWALSLSLGTLVIGALSYRWVADDAMIDFRIVDNLLHGHGLVYNVGERVEVYTNPLWVVVLTVARILFFFLPLGTIAVGLGVGLAAFAVRVAWRLGDDDAGATSPQVRLGLLGFCAIPAVWEFATSGLETSLSFAWIAVAAWSVQRHPMSARSALVVGLGSLVRPDLGVVMIALMIAQWYRARSFSTPRGQRLRLVVLGLTPTVVYELFRVAYFGVLVSNTALAKSATSLRPAVGWAYWWDFLSAYWLAPPLLVAVSWWLVNQTPWRRAYWRSKTVYGALMVGGLVNLLYVIAVGGDFMHARLLLPSLFAIGIGLRVNYRRRSAVLVVAGGLYLVVLVSGLRYHQPGMKPHLMVSDERLMQISLTHTAHPVNESDMRQSIWWRYGELLRDLAQKQPPNRRLLVLGSSPTALTGPVTFPLVTTRASQPTPQRVMAPSRTLGQVGLAAGGDVAIFDVLSLANPLSSHFTLGERTGRPGHEKDAGLAWYLARYGDVRDVKWINYYQPFFHYPVVTSSDVRDAHSAVRCGALHRYLDSTTGPLTLRRMASNVVHAWSWTRLSFDPQPSIAVSQLCPH